VLSIFIDMIPNEAFEEGSGGRIKSLRIYHVNPPIPDPWRTREDYIQDREAAIEAHQKMMDAFRLNQRMMWFAAGTLAVSFLALLLQTYQLRRELTTRQSSTVTEPADKQAQLQTISSATLSTDSKDVKESNAQANPAATSTPISDEVKPPPLTLPPAQTPTPK
jgi:cytoskeletal protein RodZ